MTKPKAIHLKRRVLLAALRYGISHLQGCVADGIDAGRKANPKEVALLVEMQEAHEAMTGVEWQC